MDELKKLRENFFRSEERKKSNKPGFSLRMDSQSESEEVSIKKIGVSMNSESSTILNKRNAPKITYKGQSASSHILANTRRSTNLVQLNLTRGLICRRENWTSTLI